MEACIQRRASFGKTGASGPGCTDCTFSGAPSCEWTDACPRDTHRNAVRGHADGRRTRLLILDDEALLLRALARTLRRVYDVTTFSSPSEALEYLASGGDSCDAILTDLMMPEMNGMEFARQVSSARPDLANRIILMSGAAYTSSAQVSLHGRDLPMISKPFDPETLHALLVKLTSDVR